MIVKISDDDIATGRRHCTEVWPGEVARVRGPTRAKLVNDATVGLEDVDGTAAIVNDNNATAGVAADTLWTKQLPRPNPARQHVRHTVRVLVLMLCA